MAENGGTTATQSHQQLPPQSWYGIWIPRAIVTVVVVLAAVAFTAWFYESTADFLLTILASFFASFALQPAVQRLVTRGWRPGVAAIVVMVIALVVLVGFFAAMFALVISQMIALVELLPGWIEDVVAWTNQNFGTTIDTQELLDEVQRLPSLLRGYGDDIAGAVLGVAGSIMGLFFRGLTMVLFIFYILAEEPKLRRAILSGLPPHRQKYFNEIWTVSIEKTGSYVYSRGILAGISALYASIAFVIIGVPAAVPLGLFVGVVSQFIPNIGTYIAGFVPALVALLNDPIDAVWVLVAILVYQQVENLLLQPRITAGTMKVHPAIAFGAAIMGALLLGALGALIAIPVAATVVALVGTYARRYEVVDHELLEQAEQERLEQEQAASRRWWRRDGRPGSPSEESAGGPDQP